MKKIIAISIVLLISLSIILYCKNTEPSNSNIYIDVHSHLHGLIALNQFNFEGAADIAVTAMNKYKIKKMLVMPPPFTNQSTQNGKRYEIDDMSIVLSKYSDRFAFLGGGEELNVMIQKTVTGSETITIDQFKAKAREISQMQGFAGFGEIATLHFCMGEGHVYQEADPSHILFQALVDVAAEKNVPIDIHQEAVTTNMAFPSLVTGTCDKNPTNLTANIEKFKSLLSYAKNKNVKIIWDHVGWDNTKKWTSTLCDELLTTYDNLYFSIKISPNDSPTDNRIVTSEGILKQEWLTLFQKYPNKFMLGSDYFFPYSESVFSPGPPSFDETWALISQLPDDLKNKIGYENAKNVFNLN